jgi:hypothetical protein
MPRRVDRITVRTTRRAAAALALVSLAGCPCLLGAQSGAGPDAATPARALGRRVVVARRLGGAITIDGRLDEAAWRTADVAGDFRQRQPVEGAPATERTEVRVLYDDAAIYVGARMYDSHPESIAAPLGRRDASPPSDEFYVQLDSYHDRRTAFVFCVTPSGVKTDLLISNGVQTDVSWDAVWEVATRVDSAGWTAEYRIPLSQLRFSMPPGGGDAELVWGANFIRWISRKGEDSQWSLIPATASAWVPYYGELRGLRLAAPPRRLEAQPYSLARLAHAPPEDGNPLVRRADAGASVGADVRYGLTPNLTLTAAVNPDFGQVEADPAEVNLTAFETFRPERRAFFMEGTDIFRVRLGEWFEERELFYSRRIGRAPQGELPDSAEFTDVPAATSILGAAKLSGKTAGGWSLGLLDALTARERGRYVDSAGRRVETTVEPLTNYVVARAIRDFRGGEDAVGVTATATHRRIGDAPALAGLRASAFTGGVDARHRWGAGAYEVTGWLMGSEVRGTREAIAETQHSSAHYFQRPDARHLRDDTTRTAIDGAGAALRVAKVGGNWRWTVSGKAVSPGFEANDLGYQPRADFAGQYASLGYEDWTPGRRLRYWMIYANQWAYWTLGGERLLGRGELYVEGQLPNLWTMWVGVDRDGAALSTDALRGGPALATPPRTNVFFHLNSDRRRRLSLSMNGTAWREDGVPSRGATLAPGVTLRPSDRLDLTLEPSVMRLRNEWQYVTDEAAPGGEAYVLGTLRQTTASLTARLTYTFTPALTLQTYAQPFVSAGAYAGLKEAADTRSPRFAARFRPLAPPQLTYDAAAERYRVDRDGDGAADYAFDRPDFNTRKLNANAVLRWEYRPGSTLFVVWTHERDGDVTDGRFRLGRDARALFAEGGKNVFLVKVSYWMSL